MICGPLFDRFHPARRAETEAAAGAVLSLPIYPELNEQPCQTVIDAVLKFGGAT